MMPGGARCSERCWWVEARPRRAGAGHGLGDGATMKPARVWAASNRGGTGHPPHVGFRLVSKNERKKKQWGETGLTYSNIGGTAKSRVLRCVHLK